MTTLDMPVIELVKRFQSGEIPESAHATVTYKDSEEAAPNPALSLAEEWLSQVPTDPEEMRDAEEDMQELRKALNATRQEAGARIPFLASSRLICGRISETQSAREEKPDEQH